LKGKLKRIYKRIESVMKHKVTLKPSGQVVEIEEGKNLLSALREENVYIKSSCGGHATCSDCIIKIVSGEDYITPPPFLELKLLGNVFHITKERLACQTCVTGDITVDITKHDKATDEEKLRNKTSQFSPKKLPTKVRKDLDIQKMRSEKQAERSLEEAENIKKSQTWKNHWEKSQTTSDSGTPKKLAGGKRPKFFDTDKVDYDKQEYTRPLSPEKQKLREERLAQEKIDNQVKKQAKEIPNSDKDFKKFRG